MIVSLADKERKKDDKSYLEHLMIQYGDNSRTLAFRILDELLYKEVKMSSNDDFSKILSKEIFLKSVLICSIETIFFIGNVR